jgi:hypothetical protein
VDLTLRGITVRKSGEVHARLSFLGRRRVGTYALAVRIDSVRGRLRPGVPALGFGDGQVRIRLPWRSPAAAGAPPSRWAGTATAWPCRCAGTST